MALAVTERTEGISAETFGTGAYTSASFTPTANSLLLVCVTGLSDNNGMVCGIDITNTGGLNFFAASDLYDCQEAATTYNVATQWFAAEVGGSPSSMTVSVQGSKSNLATLTMFVWGMWIADVTGYNTDFPIGAVGGSASRTDPGALAFNLTGTPTADSGVFASFANMYNGDGAGAITPGTGWTEAWEVQDTDYAFHVQYDITTPDISVEWGDVTAGTGTFNAYGAAAIEVRGADDSGSENHHPKHGDWVRTVTTGNASLSVTMPSGIEVGDLLIAFVAADNVDCSATGWTEMYDTANGTAVRGFVFGRIADGSDSMTITNAGAQDIAVIVVDIKDHGVTDVTAPTQGTPATGNSTAPNAPNCNPGSADEWLYLTWFMADDDDNAGGWMPNTLGVVDGSAGTQAESASSTSSVMLGYSWRTTDATSWDQAAYALAAAEEWVTGSIAIPPAIDDGGEPPPPETFYLWRRNRALLHVGR